MITILVLLLICFIHFLIKYIAQIMILPQTTKRNRNPTSRSEISELNST